VSRLLSELGHEVIAAQARKVRLVAGRTLVGCPTLAGLTRIDPHFLPVKYRSVQAQAHLTVVQARAGLVRGETTRINTARGLTKSHRERLRDSYPQDLNPKPEFPERLGD
jgi:hypothetical protein